MWSGGLSYEHFAEESNRNPAWSKEQDSALTTSSFSQWASGQSRGWTQKRVRWWISFTSPNILVLILSDTMMSRVWHKGQNNTVRCRDTGVFELLDSFKDPDILKPLSASGTLYLRFIPRFVHNYCLGRLYFSTLVFQCQDSGRNENSVGSVWSWVWNLLLVDIWKGKTAGCIEIFYFATWATDQHSKGKVLRTIKQQPHYGQMSVIINHKTRTLLLKSIRMC